MIKMNSSGSKYDGVYNRVQDKELLEVSDMKKCMSMHQPWASLLVAGIKKHEGRSWYTSHRGRLWIAATAKSPDREEIQIMENFYRKLYNGSIHIIFKHMPLLIIIVLIMVNNLLSCVDFIFSDDSIEFPTQYPTASLLGCVSVQVSSQFLK